MTIPQVQQALPDPKESSQLLLSPCLSTTEGPWMLEPLFALQVPVGSAASHPSTAKSLVLHMSTSRELKRDLGISSNKNLANLHFPCTAFFQMHRTTCLMWSGQENPQQGFVSNPTWKARSTFWKGTAGKFFFLRVSKPTFLFILFLGKSKSVCLNSFLTKSVWTGTCCERLHPKCLNVAESQGVCNEMCLGLSDSSSPA